MPRTEEEKLTQAPLKVKFGEREYEIKPLRILKQRAWRKKLSEELGPILDRMQIARLNGRTVVAGLSSAMADFPDKVTDLVFAYAPNLDQDKILDEATEEQVSAAFAKIWDLVFADFLAQLGSAVELLKPSATTQPSVSASN